MPDRMVVVVGGGEAGFHTCAALREHGFAGTITLVCGEGELPYQRPPLSKEYLSDMSVETMHRPESYYAAREITIIREPATALNRTGHQVLLANGATVDYDKLVLATGARPRALSVPGSRLDWVVSLRTRSNAAELGKLLQPGRPLVVLGAGFLGLEVAASARALGCPVTVVEPQPRALTRGVSAEVAAYLVEQHRGHGVRFLFGRRVIRISDHAAVLDDGSLLPAQVVLNATGVVPETGLAERAGLVINNGITVDERLCTSDPAIFAVGDCAGFPYAGHRIRLESVQNATDQGRHVAAVICGKARGYLPVPWFWTDQYRLRVQIAGVSAGHDRVRVRTTDDPGRFSVDCFHEDRLIAVESVQRPGDHLAARRRLTP